MQSSYSFIWFTAPTPKNEEEEKHKSHQLNPIMPDDHGLAHYYRHFIHYRFFCIHTQDAHLIIWKAQIQTKIQYKHQEPSLSVIPFRLSNVICMDTFHSMILSI